MVESTSNKIPEKQRKRKENTHKGNNTKRYTSPGITTQLQGRLIRIILAMSGYISLRSSLSLMGTPLSRACACSERHVTTSKRRSSTWFLTRGWRSLNNAVYFSPKSIRKMACSFMWRLRESSRENLVDRREQRKEHWIIRGGETHVT